MRALLGFVVLSILVAGGGVGLAYSGLVDVSSTGTEPRLIRWLLETTRESSIERRAAQVAVPDLVDPRRVSAGASAFGEMCAGCHGAPGREPILGMGDMNPSPPDLAERVPQRTSAELFWVIKHGIRMTGMPAWGPTHSDAQLWEVVAFLEQLPALSPDEYLELSEQGDGDGHGHEHGTSHGHDHGDHQGHAHAEQAAEELDTHAAGGAYSQ